MASRKPAPTSLARLGSIAACGLLIATLGACSGAGASSGGSSSSGSAAQGATSATSSTSPISAEQMRADLHIAEDYRDSFVHGEKPAGVQMYIMLHDTEEEASAPGIVEMWDNNGVGVATHFIVDRDGTITQCVPMDKIAHHAGYGDTGHGALFGVEDESRDDKVGTSAIGDGFADYGMNSYSIGIEMSHIAGKEEYPEAQLEALDKLIAYIDLYYGFESTIIDHKMWRSTNPDTAAEFATYLENYQVTRTHKAKAS